MIQSSKSVVSDRVFVDVKNIMTILADNSVWIRGRLHTSRAKGNETKKKIKLILLILT